MKDNNTSISNRVGETIFLIARLALGFVFLFSSLFKITSPNDFFLAVQGYELVSAPIALFVAAVLPWYELILAFALLGGIWLRGAMVGASALGVLFIFAQGWAIAHDPNINCGCFNVSSEETISYFTLLRTSLVLIGGLIGLGWLMLRSIQRQQPEKAA